MIFTLYHNNNCSKSRACLQILLKNNINFKIREYMKEPLSIEEIKHLFFNFNSNKVDLFRKKILNCDMEELIKLLHLNQKEIQRPIFYNGKEYIICRPPDKVLDYIQL